MAQFLSGFSLFLIPYVLNLLLTLAIGLVYGAVNQTALSILVIHTLGGDLFSGNLWSGGPCHPAHRKPFYRYAGIYDTDVLRANPLYDFYQT